MKKALLLASVFLAGVAVAWAAQTSGFINTEAQAKRACVSQLMRETRLYESLNFSIDNIVAAMPEEARQPLRAAINTDELMRRIAPVYERYLSTETLQALLAFYRTPAGQEWLRAQKPIMEDTLMVSKMYTRECVSALQK